VDELWSGISRYWDQAYSQKRDRLVPGRGENGAVVGDLALEYWEAGHATAFERHRPRCLGEADPDSEACREEQGR